MVSETEATEGGGGSLSGLLDGDDAGDNLDTDDVEDAPRDEEGGEATDEPDTNLLAVPGNRDDKVVKMAKKGSNGKVYTTTSKSKGKLYEPTDDLTGKRAMKRSMKSQAGMRGITGVPKGYKKMDRLSRGIYTEQRSNYDEQEKTILEVNNEIKNLITEMENKKDVK